jgi:hypothetical protein
MPETWDQGFTNRGRMRFPIVLLALISTDTSCAAFHALHFESNIQILSTGKTEPATSVIHATHKLCCAGL